MIEELLNNNTKCSKNQLHNRLSEENNLNSQVFEKERKIDKATFNNIKRVRNISAILRARYTQRYSQNMQNYYN